MDLLELPYAIRNNENLRNNEYVRFIGNCLANINRSQAQNFQDVWILFETGFKKNGYYVEFGATDGLSLSNSYLLSKEFGWKGILAEPNPVWHENLFKNRTDENTVISYQCVYTETGKTLDFLAVEEAGLSTIKGFGDDDEHSIRRKDNEVIEVTTVSLLDLLVQHNAPSYIDYISVDTEGSEYEILSHFFSVNKNYEIGAFTVEHNFNPDIRDKIFKLMEDNGYARKFPEFSKWDDFYIKVS